MKYCEVYDRSMNSRFKQLKRKDFAEAVRQVVRGIPQGHVLSYGEVARRAGFPGAARAVGIVMRDNFDETVPCHRVVRSDGSVGEYNRGGAKEKTRLLAKEGVRIENGRVMHAP